MSGPPQSPQSADDLARATEERERMLLARWAGRGRAVDRRARAIPEPSDPPTDLAPSGAKELVMPRTELLSPGPVSTALVPSRAAAPDADAGAPDYGSVLALSRELVPTGFLPEHIKTPGQAVAIILTGRELGMAPMRALRSLTMVKGKVVEGADSQLARFKSAGGRARFETLDETKAVLILRHPNGDEHTETFTLDDAKRAGLLGGSGWQKYPKAMLRSRAITAGLKSVGWEGGTGIYDPYELAGLPAADEVHAPAAEEAARPDEAAVDIPRDADGIALFPFKPRQGIALNAVEHGAFAIDEKLLRSALEWSTKKALEKHDAGDKDGATKMRLMVQALEDELTRRIPAPPASIAAPAAARAEATAAASADDLPF